MSTSAGHGVCGHQGRLRLGDFYLCSPGPYYTEPYFWYQVPRVVLHGHCWGPYQVPLNRYCSDYKETDATQVTSLRPPSLGGPGFKFGSDSKVPARLSKQPLPCPQSPQSSTPQPLPRKRVILGVIDFSTPWIPTVALPCLFLFTA